MIINLLAFVLGVALLWVSSELVVRNVSPIARRLGISELTVTILGVSVFSSLPELSVSAFSAMQGNADISIGNVVGSNFVTLTFVTALCALIAPINMHKEIKDRESSWMILSTVIIMLLAMDKYLSRMDGVILIGLYIPYAISVLMDMKKAEKQSEAEPEAGEKKKPVLKNLLIEAAAIGGVIISSKIALDNGQIMGAKLGIPDIVLGAIFFAFGTSLPELAIAVSATVKKRAEVSMGEIYSSNIFTALGILGICCLIHPLTITDMRILNVDIPFLILAGVLIQIFITTGLRLNRIEALVILGLYAYFVLLHAFPSWIPWNFR